MVAGAIRINAIWLNSSQIVDRTKSTQKHFCFYCRRQCYWKKLLLIHHSNHRIFHLVDFELFRSKTPHSRFLFMLVVICQCNYHLLWIWSFPCGNSCELSFCLVPRKMVQSLYRETWKGLYEVMANSNIRYSIILSVDSSLITNSQIRELIQRIFAIMHTKTMPYDGKQQQSHVCFFPLRCFICKWVITWVPDWNESIGVMLQVFLCYFMCLR